MKTCTDRKELAKEKKLLKKLV
jgi:hypothetical protein